MLFRGMLQADWEERWGTTPGWLAASGVFGLAHVTAITRPGAWAQGGFAALAGLYLGWRYQATGYRLGESIAAHAWFDIVAGATLFLLDSRDNPLGARFEFRI
jgi:membrane protease YdiL (CAAX protease family)